MRDHNKQQRSTAAEQQQEEEEAPGVRESGRAGRSAILRGNCSTAAQQRGQRASKRTDSSSLHREGDAYGGWAESRVVDVCPPRFMLAATSDGIRWECWLSATSRDFSLQQQRQRRCKHLAHYHPTSARCRGSIIRGRRLARGVRGGTRAELGCRQRHRLRPR